MALNLVRLRIEPLSGWRTPWHADTLTGMMATILARAHGAERLEADLLEPWRRGEPPFVLADACPGDLLPSPACLVLWPWPEADRKRVKRALWLTREQFTVLQQGRRPALSGEPPDPFQPSVRMRNTLDRQGGRTGAPGSLYELPLTSLSKEYSHLSLYAGVMPDREPLLHDLLTLLSESGFGADAGAGFGQFRIAGGFEDASWLDQVTDPDGWVSLSAFQPDANDPTDGYWRSFVKYGKLGPALGPGSVFKRPQLMLEAGACFQSQNGRRGWYGRLIPSEQLLPDSTRQTLLVEGKAPVQPAFALAVPMRWAEEYNR